MSISIKSVNNNTGKIEVEESDCVHVDCQRLPQEDCFYGSPKNVKKNILLFVTGGGGGKGGLTNVKASLT